MKKITLLVLKFYKIFVSPILHQLVGAHACRYLPTCSEYARIHIARDGLIKGGIKSFVRLLYCQPFAKNLPVMLSK